MSERIETTTQTITYPAGLARSLRLTDREFARELRFLAAAKLYELGRLPAEQAARLADMPERTFLRESDRVRVPAGPSPGGKGTAEGRTARELAG